jgi:hypothetical protein
MEPPFTAVYDANILYPTPLRNLFIRLAQAGLVRARWTETIDRDETAEALGQVPHLDSHPAAVRRTGGSPATSARRLGAPSWSTKGRCGRTNRANRINQPSLRVRQQIADLARQHVHETLRLLALRRATARQ